jgi:hypothetical protein
MGTLRTKPQGVFSPLRLGSEDAVDITYYIT